MSQHFLNIFLTLTCFYVDGVPLYPGFGTGSGRIRCFCLDQVPDSVLKVSLNPDIDPVSAPGSGSKTQKLAERTESTVVH